MTNSNTSHNPPHYTWSNSANKPRMMPHLLAKVVQMETFKIMKEGIRKHISVFNKAVRDNKLQPQILNEFVDVPDTMVTLIYSSLNCLNIQEG